MFSSQSGSSSARPWTHTRQNSATSYTTHTQMSEYTEPHEHLIECVFYRHLTSFCGFIRDTWTSPNGPHVSCVFSTRSQTEFCSTPAPAAQIWRRTSQPTCQRATRANLTHLHHALNVFTVSIWPALSTQEDGNWKTISGVSGWLFLNTQPPSAWSWNYT